MDDDWKNNIKSNLRFLCYNCYHNLRGNLRGKQPEWRAEQIKTAIKKLKQQEQKEK